MNYTNKLCLVSALVLGAAQLGADTIITADGSRLEGEIVGINNGKVRLATAYAGTIEIDQSKVVSMTSADPIVVRTRSGQVLAGSVADTGAGTLAVDTGSGTVTVAPAEIAASWAPGAEDPAVVAARRRWTAEAAGTISGKSGNSDSQNIGVRGFAQLAGEKDRLRFYGNYSYEQKDDVRSADEIILGTNYTYFVGPKLGWYVRVEGERDTFEEIDFRATAAFGVNYKFITRDDLKVEGRAGLSYRFEDFTVLRNGEGSDDYPGIDIGLNVDWQFAKWGALRSYWTYTPSFDDFGNYILEHDTSVVMPLALSDFWNVQIGLNQKYNSEPAPGNDELDTTYYAALMLLWK